MKQIKMKKFYLRPTVLQTESGELEVLGGACSFEGNTHKYFCFVTKQEDTYIATTDPEGNLNKVFAKGRWTKNHNKRGNNDPDVRLFLTSEKTGNMLSLVAWDQQDGTYCVKPLLIKGTDPMVERKVNFKLS